MASVCRYRRTSCLAWFAVLAGMVCALGELMGSFGGLGLETVLAGVAEAQDLPSHAEKASDGEPCPVPLPSLATAALVYMLEATSLITGMWQPRSLQPPARAPTTLESRRAEDCRRNDPRSTRTSPRHCKAGNQRIQARPPAEPRVSCFAPRGLVD